MNIGLGIFLILIAFLIGIIVSYYYTKEKVIKENLDTKLQNSQLEAEYLYKKSQLEKDLQNQLKILEEERKKKKEKLFLNSKSWIIYS